MKGTLANQIPKAAQHELKSLIDAVARCFNVVLTACEGFVEKVESGH